MTDYDPSSEVGGQYIIAFIESAGEVSPVFERKVRGIFEKHLPTVDADTWYQTAEVVAAYDEVNDQIGDKTMEQGGVESAKAIPWPDGVTTVQGALETLQTMHRQAYRGSSHENPGGNYAVKDVGEGSAHLGTLEGFPYGSAFARGVFRQVIRDFASGSVSPKFSETTPEPDEDVAWTVTW
jgi:hypothetical protein